jgi:hypothetical protein
MLGMLGGEDAARYTHFRGVAYRPDEWIFVWDMIAGDGLRQVEQHWHCGVAVRHTSMSRIFELAGPAGSVLLRMRGGEGVPEVLQGETRPPLGWQSPLYGRRAACAVIRRTARVRLPVTLDTIITLSGPGPDNTVMGETVMRWQKWAQDAAKN